MNPPINQPFIPRKSFSFEIIGFIILFSTLISGFLFNNIHLYLPAYFKIQATYPFTDSFVMVSDIVATILLAKKKIEHWYLWIAVDLVCVVLYFKKVISFLSLEYFIILGIVSYGLYHWKKQISNDWSFTIWQVFTFS